MITTLSFSKRLDFPYPWLTFNLVELGASMGRATHGEPRDVLEYIGLILEAA